GLRSGPFYSAIVTVNPNDSMSPDTGSPISSASTYVSQGAGIYYSPQYTYNITPYPGTVGNIVEEGAVTQAGWMTLNGDNFAATLLVPGQTVSFSNIRNANSIFNPEDTPVFVENGGSTVARTPLFPDGAPANAFLQ